ncbi:MAG: hypothetical protein LBN27_05105 [Prevotellaceae bacterium]|jgi:hypothetical protein|nr:hypothetical protein [Prevotellaceae bacterium]
MKKCFLKFKESGLFLFAVMLLCSAFGVVGVEAMTADAALGTPTGVYPPIYDSAGNEQIFDENGSVVDGVIELTDAYEKNPELISKHFVADVVRLDPYTYTTMGLIKSAYNWQKKENIKDHVIQVNRISTPPVQITVNTAIADATAAQVPVDFGAANSIIGLHQTIVFRNIGGFEKDGATADEHDLICRVVSKDQSTGFPVLKPINGKAAGGVKTLPDIAAGTTALRGDRIGTETQIRTEQFGMLPTPTDYFVSKRLIEFGTSGWFDNATKTIKWGNNEIKENAMIEFLRTSAPLFWLGKQEQAIFPEYKSNTPELTLFPEGLMYQAKRGYSLNGNVAISTLVGLYNEAFRDNNSGNVKYFAMGSEISPLFQELILNTTGLNINSYKNKTLNIDFSEIIFAGGKRIRLYDDPSLDDCGLNDKGFILDPKYAATYSYGTRFLPLDGVKQQERDTKGMAAIDESVHVLLNQEAHVVVEL